MSKAWQSGEKNGVLVQNVECVQLSEIWWVLPCTLILNVDFQESSRGKLVETGLLETIGTVDGVGMCLFPSSLLPVQMTDSDCGNTIVERLTGSKTSRLPLVVNADGPHEQRRWTRQHN